jgi:hypothetical protein
MLEQIAPSTFGPRVGHETLSIKAADRGVDTDAAAAGLLDTERASAHELPQEELTAAREVAAATTLEELERTARQSV